MLKLAIPFQIDKGVSSTPDNPGPITISGYANVSIKDRDGDIIIPEAWTKGGLTNYSKNPIVLAYHDSRRPIGVAKSLAVDSGGLKIVAEISLAAKEVYDLIKEGILKAFSVGFRVKDADYDAKTDLFVIKDVELFEVSVVAIPANQDSLFEVSKCFDNSEEYLQFKKSFSSHDTSTSTKLKEKTIMEQDVLNQLKDQIGEETAKAVKTALDQAAKEKADAEAAQKAAEEARTRAIELGATGAQRLVADVDKKLTDEVTDLRKELATLHDALKTSATEISKLRQSPVGFTDREGQKDATMEEKTIAVILAKSLNRGLKDTKYFGTLVEKYGEHVASAYWEDQVSLSMQNEIRQRLVMAPLFTGMTMPSSILRLPINPEAGYGTWVAASEFGTVTSSGAEGTHALKEMTLTAYKLATKEFLTYEEEDDSMIALMPIVRDALVRRQAKSVDKALLRGAAGAADPIKGISVWATAGDQVTVATTAKPTVATLAAMRRKLGVWGLNPGEIVYVVSQDVYYDLLDDTNFQTMDKVGAAATILRGQIGSANGSPVIVSGEFAAKGNTEIGAVTFNAANFIFGTYKNLRLETDVSVEYQQRLLVATQRLAFNQISTANGNAAASLKWAT